MVGNSDAPKESDVFPLLADVGLDGHKAQHINGGNSVEIYVSHSIYRSAGSAVLAISWMAAISALPN